MASGVVEYIDTMEEETTMIAMNPDMLAPEGQLGQYCRWVTWPDET